MAATSVGQIGLDLVVNQKQFNSQMSGIQSLAKKTGKILASAFAVKKLVDFGKQCIELGSDLQEVQNVVDVTFPKMSAEVDKFSKSAAASFGLSETMAKKFTGTFGSMAKAFGFSEEQAYAMGTTLTGLAGDVASFYNISQDESYTKLKSVFSGETETLKDLGVVMTQTALDSYALANGFGKTTKNMSEAEKVALRYAFVQDRLSAAVGDFSRTSDGWANQTRILKLQFDSLKASIGQGLINLFTPVIKTINTIIGKLAELATGFSKFTEILTGKKSQNTQLSTATTEADALTDSVAGVGEAAKKSAKEMKGLSGFDELNNLSSSSSSSAGQSSAGGLDISSGISPGDAEQSTNSVIGSLDSLKKKLEELANWTGLNRLWSGIKEGVDRVDFRAIETNFKTSFSSLKPIAKSAFDGIGKVARSAMNSLGKVTGGLISVVGKNIEIASGGVARFLEQENGNISNWIKRTATTLESGYNNISFSADKIFGSLWKALDDNQGTIETSIANALTAVSNGTMTMWTIHTDMWEGMTRGLKNFTEENEEEINTFFNGVIQSSTQMTDSVSNAIGGIFTSLNKWWTEDGKRIWDEIVGVFYDLVGWVMKIWVEIVKPIIDQLSEEINRLWENHLKGLWNNLLSFFTSLWDLIKILWDNWLKPIINWLIEYMGPIITNIINHITKTVGTMIGMIMDVIGGLIKALKGVIDFLVGVFTGDWKKAWNGIKTFFSGIFDAIWGIVKGTINMMINGINALWSGLYNSLRTIINGVGKAVKAAGELVGKDWGFSIPRNAPQIPRLAEGGYVRANTPQLAMIGDNRHQGEVVSPEDKLEQMALKAAQLASKNGDTTALQQMILLLKQQNELLMQILAKETGITEKELFDSVRKSAESYEGRTGKPAFSY